MKRVHPRFEDVLLNSYVTSMAKLRQFVRLWGTTEVNGVKVLNTSRVYYPSMDADLKKLTKKLGIYKSLTGSHKGVKNAWLFINPSKATGIGQNFSDEILVNNFSGLLSRTRYAELYIGPRVVSVYANGQPVINNPPLVDGTAAEVRSKFASMWDSGFNIQTTSDSEFLSLLAMCVLFDSSISVNITAVKTMSSSTVVGGTAWRISLSIEPATVTAESQLVKTINNKIARLSTKADVELQRRYARAVHGISDSDDITQAELDKLKPNSTHMLILNSFWETEEKGRYYNQSGQVVRIDYNYYLKESFITDTSLKAHKRLEYLYSMLDTDYSKKKSKWYKRLLVVAIVVAAVVASGGLGGLFAGGMTSVIAVATVVSVAALALSLTAYVASQLGHEGVAIAAQGFLKQIDPFVKIATVINVMYTIYTALAETAVTATATETAATATTTETATIATTAATTTETAGSAALAETAGSASSSFGLPQLKEVALVGLNLTTGVDLSSGFGLIQGLKVLEFSMNTYYQHQNKSWMDEIGSMQSELAKLYEAREKAQTSDLLKEFARLQPQVLAADNSVYANLYDAPYEPWATPYHNGNIQATKIHALRQIND